MSKIFIFLSKFGLLAPKVSLRTGAWHPLSKFSGCPGTRGTRTAVAPVSEAVAPQRLPPHRGERLREESLRPVIMSIEHMHKNTLGDASKWTKKSSLFINCSTQFEKSCRTSCYRCAALNASRAM